MKYKSILFSLIIIFATSFGALPAEAQTSSVLSVDVKVNGSDNPGRVNYMSDFSVTWTSTNAVGGCAPYGTWTPISPGTSLWNFEVIPNSGSRTLIAALAFDGNLSDLRYYSPLIIAVRCWGEDDQVVDDIVTLRLKPNHFSSYNLPIKNDREIGTMARTTPITPIPNFVSR